MDKVIIADEQIDWYGLGLEAGMAVVSTAVLGAISPATIPASLVGAGFVVINRRGDIVKIGKLVEKNGRKMFEEMDKGPLAAKLEQARGAVSSFIQKVKSWRGNETPQQAEAQAEVRPEARPEAQPEAQAEALPEPQPKPSITGSSDPIMLINVGAESTIFRVLRWSLTALLIAILVVLIYVIYTQKGFQSATSAAHSQPQ